MQQMRIQITTATLLKIVGVGLLLYFLYRVWWILMILFVALIFAALIRPFADALKKYRLPRGLAVTIVYVVIFGVVGLAVTLLTPVIAEDLPQLVHNMEGYWVELGENENVQRVVEGVVSTQQTLVDIGLSRQEEGIVSGATAGIFTTVTGIFGGLFTTILVLVITFYLVVQDDPLKKIMRSVVPDEHVARATSLLRKINNKLGAWMRGQLLISFIVGMTVFVGLSALRVKYAAVLGLLAALLEFVPYLGPILALIPALFLGFSQGGAITAFFVLILYIVIQQVENHILVPKIMQKAVGLNPVVSIVAILIGAHLSGIVGALLAIPVATALSVFIKDVLEKKSA